MTIQISKTKSIEWTPPWENTTTQISDVVGIELESGNAEGCPAVRLERRKDEIALVAAGFIPPPEIQMPQTWDELQNQPKLSIPSAFRADYAAIAFSSIDAYTRQTTVDSINSTVEGTTEGSAFSKDGQRSVYMRMADESSVLQASVPEYQALWLTRLFHERRRPILVSTQTSICATLASLAAQPGFCENEDEIVVFVSQSSIFIAAFRKGMPLLYRECPGIAGTAAMREAVKGAFGIDETMVDTVFANNGIIDTRPALNPLLSPVISQIELSLDYLRSRLGATISRIFVMGEPAGCNAIKRIVSERTSLTVQTPSAFDGLALPSRSSAWKDRYCNGDAPQMFLTALGAALAALGGAQ